MSKRTHPDPELALIDKLELSIVAAHDEKVTLGASADEVAAQRPAVVALAAAVCNQLREEHRARITARTR